MPSASNTVATPLQYRTHTVAPADKSPLTPAPGARTFRSAEAPDLTVVASWQSAANPQCAAAWHDPFVS